MVSHFYETGDYPEMIDYLLMAHHTGVFPLRLGLRSSA
jgi:hypothetical protein